MKKNDKMLLTSTILVYVALFLFFTFIALSGCSDDDTYIIDSKHHDHGKGHHKCQELIDSLEAELKECRNGWSAPTFSDTLIKMLGQAMSQEEFERWIKDEGLDPDNFDLTTP